MKVLGMGNALVDILASLNDDKTLESLEMPKGSMTLVDLETSNFVNSKTAGLMKQKASGGAAANTIHGLAHLGEKTGFIGKVGQDDLGNFFRKDMKVNKIEPILFKSITDTGRAMALISPDSERTFATFLGAAVELDIDDLNSNLFEGYDYFFIEGYLVQNHELIEKAVRLAKKGGLKICIDMASFNVVNDHKAFFLKIIKEYVDIVFANELEAKSLTGEEPEKAIYLLGEMCDIAVVKIGSKGSYIMREGKVTHVEARLSTPVDTTGAGDIYAAGFLYGLIHQQSLEICGTIGSLLASKVIEVFGAKLEEATWEILRREIKQLMKE